MSKKVKVFYIIDIVVMCISVIGMILLESKHSYGLAALSCVGYFTILLLTFIISVGLVVVVSLVYFMIYLKRKQNKEK